VDRKHVDFLLCDPRTMRPLIGLELDDRSHQRSDRQERDEFVEQVFAAARLPQVRVPAKWAYHPQEMNSLIREKAGLSAAPPTSASGPARQEQTSATAPSCPKCGAETVLRTARSGANRGKQFWGVLAESGVPWNPELRARSRCRVGCSAQSTRTGSDNGARDLAVVAPY
jgi:hypothetical protein